MPALQSVNVHGNRAGEGGGGTLGPDFCWQRLTIYSEVLEEGNELPTDALRLNALSKSAQIVRSGSSDHGGIIPAELAVQTPQL